MNKPLPLALPQQAREAPLFARTSAPVAFGDGFYDEERHGLDVFRWMRPSGRLEFAPHPQTRYLELWVLSEYHDLTQELHVSCGAVREDHPLVAGWAPLSVTVPAGADHAQLSVNKPFPAAYHPLDSRTLAVRLRPPLLHEDAERHAHIRRQHENAVRNTREMLAGSPVLSSTPVSLGIDLYGVCNVKPPCVYCEWDHNKALEGDHVDTPFTVDTLKEWGPFFDNSVNLVNCSIGEPFMMKNLDELLDVFGNAGKVLEMTTNGQILTDRNIQKLLGRPIDLYISLDAGTPETYAKLRNQRFDAILHNLRRLIAAKGGPGGLPRVHLVFMPMRVNVHELEAFVRICADLRVDRMVLRPLNYSDAITLDWERGGYRYEYQKELLPFEELVRVSGRAAELCRRAGIELADQLDFGGALGARFDELFEEGRRSVADAALPAGAPVGPGGDTAARQMEATPVPLPPPAPAAPITAPLPSLGAEHKPACTEPWKSLYILRRGVFPCCYGGEPIAPMEQYREAWNSPLMQGIRSELAAGRFHTYCLKSAACPIIRKSEQADDLPASQAAYMRLRRVWTRLDRASGGRLGDVLHRSRLAATGARRAITEPEYRQRQWQRMTRRPPP